MFSGEAYNVEQGATSDLFPHEREEAPGCRYNRTPESPTNFGENRPLNVPSDVVKFAVFMRMLGYTAKTNADMLSESYVSGYYAPFFNTEDFQLWSMNNIDLRIKKNWRSYKWPAKEVISKFTRDADYRDNKLKRGSLVFLIAQHVPFNFIDENFRFHENVSPEEFYEPGNDFL